MLEPNKGAKMKEQDLKVLKKIFDQGFGVAMNSGLVEELTLEQLDMLGLVNNFDDFKTALQLIANVENKVEILLRKKGEL
jgi:beta-phosphoglucomutase-like phosphatase (HAD superfamily)